MQFGIQRMGTTAIKAFAVAELDAFVGQIGMTIYQGHRYTYEGQPVLAMEDATRGLVRVRRIDFTVPVINMQRAIDVESERLVEAPLKYLRGQVPGAHGGCA